MLTDLSFIATGKPWPTEDKDEADRLKEHAFNRMLYNNLHKEIFQEASQNYKVDDEGNIIIILGWAAKATRNYVSLCIGEPPDVEINEVDTAEERPDEEVLIDVSRYGIGLYEPTQDGIFAQNPENCYLVNAPGNVRKVTEYVFFSQFPVEKQVFIKFTIHGRGYIQHLIYELKGDKLGENQPLTNYPAYKDLIVDPLTGIQKTGVDDILIVRVDNALSSDRGYGQSDYSPAAVSQIKALEETFADRKKVLKKFAKPVLLAPESAFNHFNHANQTWEIHLDEPILAEPGSMEAKYLTWQAELGAVENAIKDMLDQLLQELDLVKQEELGQASSGTALAFRLLPTRSRVRKFATGLKAAIPKVLSLKSKLDVALNVVGAVAFESSAVSVTMQDGIPRDPVQETTWATQAFQNQGMSLETYICVTQGLEYDENPDSAMMKEVSRIKGAQQAQQQASAISGPPKIQSKLIPPKVALNGELPAA